MAIRWHLFWMVFAACLPLIMLTVWLGITDVNVRQNSIDEDAHAMAASIRQTVDAGLTAKLTGLSVLAMSHSLSSPAHPEDFSDFYAEAVLFARQQGSGVALKELDGRMVLSTATPLGSPLPRANAASDMAQLLAGQPAVTDVFTGAIQGKATVNLEVPVFRDGQPRQILALNLLADDMQAFVVEAPRPEGWGIAILDSKGRFVARSRNPATGQLAHPALVEAVGERIEGWQDTVTREGIPVSNILLRSRVAPWTIVVGVPKADLYRPVKQLTLTLVVVTIFTLILAAALSAFFGRRIVVAIGQLAAEGEGGRLCGISEIDTVANRLRAIQDGLRSSERHQRELAQQADALRCEAERASQTKSRFLAAASHDLRQPMQALFLFTGGLSAADLQPRQRELLTQIERSLDAMKMLLDGMLDISMLDAGIITPEPRAMPLSGILDTIEAEYRGRARAKHLDFRAVPCSLLVRTDPLLLGRMLRNLLENALRYTERGRVLMGCRRARGHLLIQVWDTGIGIEERSLTDIFEEFVQVGNPERDREKGLGVGLAIVKRLSQLLAHPVSVMSTPGRGSVFSVKVPMAPDASAPPAALPQTGSPETGSGLVLAIDDDHAVRTGLGTLMEGWGYRVIAAPSWEAALEALHAEGQAPDIIVADHRLRDGETGIEIIAHLRRRFDADLPAILLTGDTGPEVLRQVQKTDRVRVIHKPVTPDKLKVALSDALTSSMPRPRP